MSKKVKSLAVPVEKFDPSRLSSSEFVDNPYAKGTLKSFVNYNHPTLGEDTILLLQTEHLVLTQGGVPKFNPDFHKKEKDRAFFRMALEPESETYKKLVALDKRFSSDEFKKEHFGKHWKKYKMYPIVKIPEDDEDDEREYKPSMKVRFDLEYNEEDPDACVIKTQTYTVKEEDGKKHRTLYDKHTVDDMSALLRLNSKYRVIMRPMKFWASAKKEYGMIWKAIKLEVEPSSQGNALLQQFYDEDGFVDSDDSEDEAPVKASKAKAVDSDDSDNSGPEEDSDDEVTQKLKSKLAKTKQDSDDSDDSEDSDSDSPVVPVRKSKGKSKRKNL